MEMAHDRRQRSEDSIAPSSMEEDSVLNDRHPESHIHMKAQTRPGEGGLHEEKWEAEEHLKGELLGRLKVSWKPIRHLHLEEACWPWPPSGHLVAALALTSPKVKAEQQRRAQRAGGKVGIQKAAHRSPKIRLKAMGILGFQSDFKRW